MRAAVFDAGNQEPWACRPAVAARVATGVLAEVREDAIVLDGDRGTELFAVSPSTVTWLGARTSLSALRRGDPLTIRYQALGGGASGPPLTAERIWARVGRVTGTIVDVSGDEFLVDAHGRDRQRIVASPTSLRKIQVRFPRLAPGYLLDVIGTRHHDYLLAVAPATAQPPYRAADAPTRPMSSGPIAVSVSGSAVWHEPDREPPGLLGVGYPALDPEAGGHVRAMGCVRLPYLSLGSLVRVRKECTGQTATLPVTSDGVTARQFCDRCTGCGTSPKGQVADLTMAAFVELGGDLEDGCFNATLTTMLVLPGVLVNEVSVLTVVREVHIALLAALLISGCGAKVWSMVQAGTAGSGPGPTATFPLWPRRPAAIALCGVEFAIGIGLLLTAGRSGTAAFAVRLAAALLFGTAAGALYVLRTRRPNAGCGCFGELSRAPVGWRVIARAGLLCTAALVSLYAPPFRMPASAGQAWLTLAVAAGELALLSALSPEISQLVLRLNHVDPCEAREVPVARTLSALRASAQWRRYQRFLVAPAPADVWREGCWRFVVYPGILASRSVEVVFAVHLSGRGAPIRVGVLDADADFPSPSLPAEGPLQLSNVV